MHLFIGRQYSLTLIALLHISHCPKSWKIEKSYNGRTEKQKTAKQLRYFIQLNWIKYLNCSAEQSSLQRYDKLQKKTERKLEKHNKNYCCSCSMEEFAVDPPSDFPAFGSLKAVWFRAKCTAIDSAALQHGEWKKSVWQKYVWISINRKLSVVY